MNAPEVTHPNDRSLRAFGLGRLDDRSADSVERHLASCPECRRRAATLSSDAPDVRAVAGRGRPESPPPVGSSFPDPPTPMADPAAPARPAAEDLPPGLADNPDYEVIRELGRGGMGVVYLARNTLMGRPEVLKVVSGHLLDRGQVRERFLREVRNAAQLQHPNIVTAYSAMRAGDRIVLAMEYVEGYDLAGLVKQRGPLAVAHACHFIYQAALGLQHAHERGMVHRDIKPGNLMIARQGNRPTVKILDFGLAKATQEAPLDGGLTREGQMLGTPDYIAPEQSLDAQKADIRADIYSLGCTLYYLLTGGPPFDANSLYEILQAHHSRDATPLNLVRPDVPAELAALVGKMMAKAPERRFQTPGEVAQALRPFFKPGEAGAMAAAGPVRAAEPVAVAVATPRRPAAPAPAVGEERPAQPVASLPVIETGPAEGRSPSRPSARPGAAKAPPWAWIVVGAGALLLGLLLARNLVVDAGRERVSPPPGLAAASNPEGGRPRVVEPPRRATPPGRDVPRPEELARTSAREGPIEGGAVAPAPRPAAREPAPAAIATGRDDPGTSPAPAAAIVRTSEAIPKAAPPASRPPDFRRLVAVVGPNLPADRNPEPPRLGFWPILRPDDMTAWQVGDPDRIEMDRHGVSISAGPGGNLLLTKREFGRKCTLKITISAKEGTEAFLALRAHRGPDGWRAITSRVYDEGGRIRAGYQSADFQLPEHGTRPEIVAPGKSFRITFEIDAKGTARLLANQKDTSAADYAKTPAGDDPGAAGVFVKSGTLVIHAMDVN